MARTIGEISTYLKTCFVGDETIQVVYGLDELKTFDEQFSKVSVETILIYVFAASAWVLEQMWETFRTQTEQKIDDAYVTSLRWYYRKALDFQKGDALAFDEKTYSYKYPVVDAGKRVVKNVAVRQVTDGDVTKLKIYFSDAQKNPLTGDVRQAFEVYMREVGAAGIHYLFVSESPDSLRIHLRIYYNPLVLDSNGVRLNGGGKPVEEVIENYLNGLEYGGVFYVSKLVDMIQTAEGVKDVEMNGTTWKGTKEDRRRIDADAGAFVYVRDENDIVYSID